MSQKHSEATFVQDPLWLVVGKPTINASVLKRLYNICNLIEAPFVPIIHVCSFLGAYFRFLLPSEEYFKLLQENFKLLHGQYFKNVFDLITDKVFRMCCWFACIFSNVIF